METVRIKRVENLEQNAITWIKCLIESARGNGRKKQQRVPRNQGLLAVLLPKTKS